MGTANQIVMSGTPINRSEASKTCKTQAYAQQRDDTLPTMVKSIIGGGRGWRGHVFNFPLPSPSLSLSLSLSLYLYLPPHLLYSG